MPFSGISNPGPVPGILYALDAANLTTELWNSQMNASRDSVGNYAKFVPPTVANGRVYLSTFSNQLLVYGSNPRNSSQIVVRRPCGGSCHRGSLARALTSTKPVVH
jgi:outer membrane protein assembly factor BamB